MPGLKGFLPLLFLLAFPVLGEAVRVHYLEGSTHGYLSLRSLDGKLLGSGDLTQTVHGAEVITRLVYRFLDGSVDDETAVFTQHGVFRLLSDRHIQEGPYFSQPSEVSFDTGSGQVTVRTTEHGQPKTETTHMDLPPDLANGIIIMLLKNISARAPQTTVSYLALNGSKPRLVHFVMTPSGLEPFRFAGTGGKAVRFRVHIDLGGMLGVVAPVVGKAPPDSYAWVATGPVPTFLKSQNPLALNGPLVTTELTTPTWH